MIFPEHYSASHHDSGHLAGAKCAGPFIQSFIGPTDEDEGARAAGLNPFDGRACAKLSALGEI